MEENSDLLIKKAQKGDMDAFAALFEPMRAQVLPVAARLVGPDNAEDVVMEAYLRAWKALPRFGGRSSLKTWLYRIVHNCAVDMIRSKSKGELEMSGREGGNSPEADIPDEQQKPPDVEAADRETAQMVSVALDKISPEHRATLLLRYADGLSYTEIAAATGVSLGTVMSRLFNGKRRLKAVIGSELDT